jgi:hypothetical protein
VHKLLSTIEEGNPSANGIAWTRPRRTLVALPVVQIEDIDKEGIQAGKIHS